MSILSANLKHLYQRRSAWLWYLIIMTQVPHLLNTRLSDYHFGYFLINLFTGMLAGAMQKDILTKPFSFCLPRHGRIPNFFIFLVGATVNIILAYVAVRKHSELNFLSILALILGSMIIYLIGVYLGFEGQEKFGLMRRIVFMLLFGGIIFFKENIQNMIVKMPLIIIILGVGTCVWFCNWLRRDNLARKFCGKLTVNMLDSWNSKKISKIKSAKLAEKSENLSPAGIKFTEQVQAFFLEKMSQNDFLSKGRYVWGNIYASLGGIMNLSNIKNVMLIILGISIFSGYFFAREDNKFFTAIFPLIFMPAFMMNLNLSSCPTLLIPAGRKQKFYAIVGLATAWVFIGTILVSAMIGISLLLKSFLPDITLHVLKLSYHALNINLMPIFFLIISIIFCVVTVFPKDKLWRLLVSSILIGLIAAANMLFIVSKISYSPMWVVMLAVLFWILFLYILDYRCKHKSLI